ncbi:hypothetical protein pdam_00020644 [Pocillopora damicornis]|uniref:Peroxiredoxin-5 n=1 Tax=Pocillopora damicornis TaxID=46731 RepID=A0A3M6UXS5_POCDA|nr:hypothetical protein pdam_00020644 [Pocillopora damicornis]
MQRSVGQLSGIASVFLRGFRSSAFAAMPIKIGDKLPSVQVMEGTPKDKVNVATLFSGKKGVLFAVPGAFTPGCSKTHLPGYVEDFEKFKEKGVEVVACISVNDPFVMAAWGEAHKCDGKIRMLADTQASFLGVMAVTVDRFLAVYLHLRYQQLVTHKRIVAVVTSIWVFSAFASFIRLSGVRFIQPVIQYIGILLGLVVITGVYIKLYFHFKANFFENKILDMEIATAGGLIRRCFGLHRNGSYQFFVRFFVLVYFYILPSEAVDMELDARPFLGNVRSKRYVMVIEDGLVTALNVEPDGTGLSCSLANSILSAL